MKRLLFAGLLVLPFALTRTGARAEQDDAYGSLVGMAGSAAGDRGPEAGDIPPDNAAAEGRRIPGAPSGDAPETEFGSAQAVKTPKKPSSAGTKTAQKGDDAPSVAVPAVSAPRTWTKVFSSLVPSMTRVPAYEVAASTAPRRARPEPAREATAASAAGSAQGLLELVAAATAPSVP